ncbi:unnamed protein product [Durusdinium trenchii]|uniref:Uncharacterized protein n=1 Tax=Durusdinium trenchii TaxID=1381693 RepID=A0ABP0I8W7_9DINO
MNLPWLARAPSLLQRRMGEDEKLIRQLQDTVLQMKEEMAEIKAMKEGEFHARDELSIAQAEHPPFLALLSKLQNQSSPLSSFCRAKPQASSSPSSPSSPSSNARLAQSNATMLSACAADHISLMEITPTGTSISCCPTSSVACAGCAAFSGGHCQKCEGGFVWRQSVCVACSSASEWASESGKACSQLSANECSDVPVKGQSSNQACCECGGGHVTPTPFEYPTARWSLSSELLLKPEPRTATRYTLDAQCELSQHNLTMDASSGEIRYVAGKEKPKEAFSFPCEVTAHQAPGISFTAVVTVAADAFSYRSSALLFGTQTETPLTTGSHWSSFSMACAPKIPWLSINAHTGELSSTHGQGGGVSVVEEKFYGQDGGICTVSAWRQGKMHQTAFVALKPRPWPLLQYELDSVAVSLGQELLPMKPKVPSGMGLMKPFTFSVACTVTGGLPSTSFTYDRLLHMGFVDGHSVLELDLDGELLIAPSDTLAEVFDQATQTALRKSLALQCRVVGLFPDPTLAPVETTLQVHIQDSICWVPQSLKGIGIVDPNAGSEQQCRTRCRLSALCANYRWESSTCFRYDGRSDGSPVMVNAKVTNCTDEGTCMQVQHPKWYLSGRYCPMGRDAQRGGTMYRREQVTPEDAVYLYKNRAGDGCSSGQWVLQKINGADYMEKALGSFELRGPVLDCVASSQVSFALDACPTKLLLGEEEDEGLPPLILDDPGTPEPSDYWLHPCDCAPPAWSTGAPVNAEKFEEQPAESQNDYIPSPFIIVSGQFVCPSRQLLPKIGIQFQTEEELLEPSDCEARCRDHSDCQFFWSGAQHGAATCRLFQGCDTLVREFSLEGELKALPRQRACRVADAELCWATSLRRSFLTMAFRSGSAAGNAVVPEVVPPPPVEPPASGMVAWFKSEHAGSTWKSSVGDWEGVAVRASAQRTVLAGYGADRPVAYVAGGSMAGFYFGTVLKRTFTLCSVTRYTGWHRGRILQTAEKNFLHGHWSEQVGVAHYDKWVTHTHRNRNFMDWLVMCGTNAAARIYDATMNVASDTAGDLGVEQTLVINNGAYNEVSDFGVMEVITWDRALSDAEMLTTVEYLQWKLKAGTFLEAEPRKPFRESNFVMSNPGGAHYSDNVQDQTFHLTLDNGYTVSLHGWTHTRDYAGFLRNQDGHATAQVTGLSPNEVYLYEIFSRDTSGHFNEVNLFSVNRGREATISQDIFDFPRAVGVATADAHGGLLFTFRRWQSHVHLSGLHISKIGHHSAPPKPADPPSAGMVAWFKSENAGSSWPSSVGHYEGVSTQTHSCARTVGAGYGADRPVTYVRGRASSGMSFGPVIKRTFTLCSVTRYDSTYESHRNRILQTTESNFLHGHWHGQVGVAHYNSNGWQTDTYRQHDSMDWLVFCGTNAAARIYDDIHNVATKTAGDLGMDQNLVINPHEGVAYIETSDFAVMEIITLDRALSDAEMLQAVNYLKWKLAAGSFLEAEHLSDYKEFNFVDHVTEVHQNLNDIAGQTFQINLKNGYSASLTGWTHTRDYAGFLRNAAGKATCTVKGLVPGAQYLYVVFARDTSGHFNYVNYVSVNHGREATMMQDAFPHPRFNGVTLANPRGEIVFEFTQVNVHVHFSSLAIAPVKRPYSALQLDSAVKSMAQALPAVEAGFTFIHLYQQCDTILLLGGMGVEHCGRPEYRAPDSHEWRHKRPLPGALGHGSVLMASCWTERYRLTSRGASLSGATAVVASERLQCISGRWYNSLSKENLQDFSCDSCVQVAAHGFAAYHLRREQELYYFNRMALSVYTELGMIKELSAQAKHRHCLEPLGQGPNMTVTASLACPANILAQVSSLSSPLNRHLRLLPEDLSGLSTPGQCLTARHAVGVARPGLAHAECSGSDEKQLLAPGELPSDMWNLHVEAEERTQDLHKAYSSYCGTSGALSNLDFGQVFAGDLATTTKCKFAPLVAFGTFKDSGIFRDKGRNDWPDWHHMMADHPVECENGEALTAFKLEIGPNTFQYECSKIGGLGSCFDYWTPQVEVKAFNQWPSNWVKTMRMLRTDCGENSVIAALHFEYSEGGKWARSRYRCCKAGGAPITFDPRGQVADLVSPFDGVYCPGDRDVSGRLRYVSSAGKALSFDRDTGKWCIGSDCSAVTSQDEPKELPGAVFDVVNVSDFDGEFLGAGVPGDGVKKLSLEEVLKLKPPKRPPQPPMPKLEVFKAEQPKYAAECLDYQNLWKEVSETFKNEEDETVTEISRLEAEPSTQDLPMPDYHPCEVAKSAGGIFGPIGGGDGSTAPENMMYSDWNDCMQGDIERDLISAEGGYHSAMSGFIQDMVEEGIGLICKAIPDVTIAPWASGWFRICDGAAELVGAIKKFSGPTSEFAFAKKEMEIQEEGYAACNPLQVGFARAFCDIHCVRDAVIRGDRSIIRNLELATKKTNNNLQKLVQWSVDAARTETGWLGEKLDYMHTISSAYLAHIYDLLRPDDGLAQRGALSAAELGAFAAELRRLGEGAAAGDALQRATAQEALQRFLDAPEANASTAAAFLGRLDSLQQTLQRAGRRGASKEQLLSRQTSSQARRLQRTARKQLSALGVYRIESQAAKEASQHLLSSQEHFALASLDKIWWKLREKLEKYLDVAELEVQSFQHSIEEMQHYVGCEASFTSLAASYTQSMHRMTRSHRLLKRTWREATLLMGELSSTLQDTEALKLFVKDQGCDSHLVKETMKQVRSALFGLALLQHRFAAAKLAAPGRVELQQAVRRIEDAYQAAHLRC